MRGSAVRAALIFLLSLVVAGCSTRSKNDVAQGGGIGLLGSVICFAAVREPLCFALAGVGVGAGLVAKNRREELSASNERSLKQIRKSTEEYEGWSDALRQERQSINDLERYLATLASQRTAVSSKKNELRNLGDKLRERVKVNEALAQQLYAEIETLTKEVNEAERRSGGNIRESSARVAALGDERKRLFAVLDVVADSTANITDVLRRYRSILDN